MDQGAHFYRSDFQVHSPRDPQWTGTRPSTEEERMAYAQEFVAACRERGIDAVAITDHHDLTFFPYIKNAAEGNPIVFPGMELTLSVPCQALLILDADFPESLLSQIPSALGITVNEPDAPIHAETRPIPDTTSIKLVSDLLERQDYLRGRYILIPNVTPTGHKTLIRAGFNEHYKSAPCIAGYVDGGLPSEDREAGWRAIVSGRDANYGNKRLGIFQTSDSRHRDFRNLGSHSTWVKWATPTAEALRQACLASETRISQNEPELPRVTIRKLSVSNCRFLGPLDIDFNSQYNSLIGGRGTGKSTVLEYLRWALCDQPPSVSNDGELPDFQTKRDQLIKKTLIPHDAVVTVEFELNGVRHAVRRKAEPRQILLKIGDDEYKPCNEQDIRELLPIQAYSQKQLSIVGVRSDELLRLLEAPIKTALLDFDRQESELKDRIRSAADARHKLREAKYHLRREEMELASTRAQLEKMREGLKGLNTDDQRILDQHPGYEMERGLVSGLKRLYEGLVQTANEFSAETHRLVPTVTVTSTEESPNSSIIKELNTHYNTLHSETMRKVSEILIFISNGDSAAEFNETLQRWQVLSEEHERNYEQAKDRTSSQKAALDAISELEKKSRAIQEQVSDRKAQIDRMGDPDNIFAECITEWLGLNDQRGDLLESECQKLTQRSAERIRATLHRGHDASAITEALAAIASGTRIRREKFEALAGHIVASDNPLREWCEIAEEFYELTFLTGQDLLETDLPPSPKLNAIGFTSAELLKVAGKITLSDWVGALSAGIESIPVFEYQQAEADFIDFANASAGQQATALLHVLLNQTGPPLIIDQPEDDLDNEVVLEIVAAIWKAKTKRQLIVSSHNANVVVNGDADLVVVFGYRQAGDHSRGQVTHVGAIDVPTIRNAITGVMEGGERAFRLRKEKYGF